MSLSKSRWWIIIVIDMFLVRDVNSIDNYSQGEKDRTLY